jgi:CRP/FNR family cyclic AMP-dependent transcriptional regulator
MKASALRELLSGYSNAELDHLRAATRVRHFPAGAWLFREGDPASSCFFIATGAVEMVKFVDGEKCVLATLRPGTQVGQTGLVQDSLRSASVRAKSATTAFEIKRRTFQRFVQQGSPLAVHFQEQIAIAGIRQLRAAADQLALVLAQAVRPSGKQPATVDRRALAFIQAGTGEWDLPLDRGASPPLAAKKRAS